MNLSRVVWHKSSHSGNGGEDCVEVGVWCKSSYSPGNGGDCVEVGNAHAPDNSPPLLVRDSKDPSGPRLAFTAPEWESFLTRIKTATVDHAH